MRSQFVVALSLSTAAILWAPAALPCGGGFGTGLQIGTSQNIIVSYKGGIETYFFSPHFCGLSAQFGYILPVLAGPDRDSHARIDRGSHRCPDLGGPRDGAHVFFSSDAGPSGSGYAADGGGDSGGPTVQVIDKGQVGIFDYSVIKADTVASFTDWLDADQYPYTVASAAPLAYYVSEGWYFVAFKVTADSQNPPSGQELCGDLGPIELAFPGRHAGRCLRASPRRRRRVRMRAHRISAT